MIGGNFGKPNTGGAAPAPLPQGGVQNQQLQQRAQANVPYQGQFNGNPRGAANMPNNPQGFRGQGQAPAWSQQTNLGRYAPPTMTQFGGGAGGFNSNQWNNQGGYDYNLPGSYGSPLGQGQFAPMPQQFQQYLQQMSQQFPQYQQQQMGFGGMGGGMPPGKDGRPLMEGPQPGMAPMFGQRRRPMGGRGAEMAQQQQMEPMPAYDQPENRNYNMAALRQMMGGY
jgi:hypothetical protein